MVCRGPCYNCVTIGLLSLANYTLDLSDRRLTNDGRKCSVYRRNRMICLEEKGSIFMFDGREFRRTSDDETSPTEILDEVDLELGVCPLVLN